MAKRLSYQAQFKSKVAIEALKENKTLADLAQEFKLHPAQITRWKTQALRGLSQLFEDGRNKKKNPIEDTETLYAQIGKLQAQLEFLKKKPGLTTHEMRMLIEGNHPILSIEAQCEALGLPRSSYYYSPVLVSEETLGLMKRIEEMHYKNPEYGYRKIHVNLRKENFQVNEKRIERLWNKLGFCSLLPRKNLSRPALLHSHYSYLSNGKWIGEPNQVFSTDITFLPMANGFIYLATITDWYSRYILAYELSNTMTVDFCLAALAKALQIAYPKYFNMDQGSQFTCSDFLKFLQERGIKISMDGRGRCLDNVYQERGWWSLKYEKIYLHRYGTVKELHQGVDEYVEHFNHDRPHQGLLYATPYEIYYQIPPKFSKGDYRGFEVKKAKNVA